MEISQAIEAYKLNPFFRIQIKNPIVLDLFLEGRSVELSDIKYLKLIARLNKTTLSEEQLEAMIGKIFAVNSQTARKILSNLIEQKVLVNLDYRIEDVHAVNHWVKRGWIDALMLHLKTRNIDFSDNNVLDPDRHNAEVIKAKINREGLPEFWKNVEGETIALPVAAALPEDQTFQDVIIRRRTHWKWRGDGIRLQEIANILYYGSFETVKLRKQAETTWQADPEAILNSSFCALEIYLFVFNIDSLEPGLYHYDLQYHRLICIKKGLFNQEVSRMCIGQQRPGEASCAVVLTTHWKRYMYRYNHPRAYRTLLINTSELAQKFITLATTYKLVPFLTPAFDDQYADALLGVDGYEEAAGYLLAFG